MVGTLNDLFTNIANSIRTKKGTENKIIAENFPSEIDSIVLGTDTSSADAIDGDILLSKTAFVNGIKITGTMHNNSNITETLDAGDSYIIPAGYHNGTGIVNVDVSNLSAENIKDGVTIGGVLGTYLNNLFMNILTNSVVALHKGSYSFEIEGASTEIVLDSSIKKQCMQVYLTVEVPSEGNITINNNNILSTSDNLTIAFIVFEYIDSNWKASCYKPGIAIPETDGSTFSSILVDLGVNNTMSFKSTIIGSNIHYRIFNME